MRLRYYFIATLLVLCLPSIAPSWAAAGPVGLSAATATRAESISEPDGPLLSVSPFPIAFGNVTLGEVTARILNVSNRGNQTLSLSSAVSSDPHFTIPGFAPSNIPAGSAITLTVRYEPTSLSDDAGTLTLNSNAVNGAVAVPLTGSGVLEGFSELGAGRILFAPGGEAAGDQFGLCAGSAGDVNGDGYPDVIASAWTNDAGGVDAGRAYVYLGGPNPTDLPFVVLQGAGVNDNFGTFVSSAGDFNADGYDDVIVGAWLNDGAGQDAGRAYLYYGGPTMDAVADRVFTGQGIADRFGIVTAAVGDVNGDGYDDVLVGAFLNDAGGTDAGRAYVFFGGPAADNVADWTLTGAAPFDHFGWSAAGAGDLNGDGYHDIIVGAYGNDAGGTDAGRAYVFFGGASPNGTPDIILTGVAGDRFGIDVVGDCDVNGDGRPDLIVGADEDSPSRANIGHASVYYGAPVFDAVADLTLYGDDLPNGGFGRSLAAADVDANGSDDIIVGAWLHNGGGALAGRCYLYRGGSAADANPDEVYTGEGGGDRLGNVVRSVGDMDGDGREEFVIGAYFNDVFHEDAGRAYVLAATIPSTPNEPPVLSAPASVAASEGALISFGVQASDPDGDHVTLGAQNRPVGSVFVDLGTNAGTFSWTPGFGQSGSYTVTFTGQDIHNAAAAPRNVAIVVDNVNRAPTAAAGGPYAGVVNIPITFDGTASSDPDGDPLSYAWAFGDNTSGSGPNPQHAYAAGGVYTVSLTVSDGAASAAGLATATVQDVFPSAAFLEGGNKTTRLSSGKSETCVQIEPVDGSYRNTSVAIESIEMISPGTGSVDRIAVIAGKTTLGSDRDRNGVDEITACFAKDDLRALFSGLSGGRHTVGVTLEGSLTTGGRFRTVLEMDVVASGHSVAAFVSPNPLNPTGTLTFFTTRPGSVAASLFDSAGRLVRTMLRRSFVQAGYHDVTVDGRNDAGARLSSGVYFYRVVTDEGTVAGRVAILK